MKKITFISVSIFIYFIFTQSIIIACGCPDDPDTTLEQTVKSNVERAKAVFWGEVIEIKENSQTHIASVKIRVKEYWKNTLPEEIVIITDFPYGMSCGYGFEIGENYLIFAHDSNNDILRTNECSGNRKIEKAAEELKILGEGKRPDNKKQFRNQQNVEPLTTQIFWLKHLKMCQYCHNEAERLMMTVLKLLSKRGSVEIDIRANSFIIIDERENIKAIKNLMARLNKQENN